MVIALLGDSGSGKSTIENILADKYDYKKIISYTSRNKRPGEVSGKDYFFVDNETFKKMIKDNSFAEYDEYSQERFYGTTKYDYGYGEAEPVKTFPDKKVVVLTPNGLRQLKKKNIDVFSVYVKSNLGTRVKRYIDRCGVDKFNFDDKNEIASRVERDFAMFLGIEKEVNMVVENNDIDDVYKIAEKIHYKCQELIQEEMFSYTE